MPLKKPSVANHTLVNGLRLLERIAASEEEFSVSDLAAESGLPKSHVHRLLRTLVETGYLDQSADTRKYRSDYRLLALAGPFAERLPLRIKGGPVLRTLSETAKSNSYLGVLHQGSPLIIMSDLYGGRPTLHDLGVGTRLSRHSSAFGKLFLALNRLTPEAGELRRFTPYTITTLREFREEMATIRRQGYSVNRRENNLALYSFAAPVRNATAVLVGAIGVAVSASAVTRQGEEKFIRLVVESAANLSGEIR